MSSKQIGLTIKKFREERKLSQEVLSGLPGIDRSHLSKLELGIRSPTLNVLYKLAEAMDVRGSEILLAAEKQEEC